MSDWIEENDEQHIRRIMREKMEEGLVNPTRQQDFIANWGATLIISTCILVIVAIMLMIPLAALGVL